MQPVDGRVPNAGDVFWIEFGAPVGHEQAGRRPCVVLTPQYYNERSSIFLACPISRRSQGWPFQVAINQVGRISGYALVDQVRAIDPLARLCRFAGRVSDVTLGEIRIHLGALFEIGTGS